MERGKTTTSHYRAALAAALMGDLPAGTYRIVATYDEGRTFGPENRTSRVIRSEPVEIVVTAR